MIETGLRPARNALPGGAGVGARGTSRLATRLWTLLHAQALLRGTITGMGDALAAEDDRWRLAAHREGAYRR